MTASEQTVDADLLMRVQRQSTVEAAEVPGALRSETLAEGERPTVPGSAGQIKAPM
ncbi:hypothetical protein [Cellulosimicrobium funkei]|uniref:hypothetical protein n=1 Tax=Cellulosimicrobium funkei TaxID=264251 RepID=UPI000A944E5C|nr:hypothetical protein [Cellulosimicrobium funkei]